MFNVLGTTALIYHKFYKDNTTVNCLDVTCSVCVFYLLVTLVNVQYLPLANIVAFDYDTIGLLFIFIIKKPRVVSIHPLAILFIKIKAAHNVLICT